MPTLVPQQAPPPDYYACNVRYLLAEVLRRSGELLTAPERHLIEAFSAAGSDPQRLLARLLTRRGRWLRVDSLQYSEVSDLAAALDELCRTGLVARLPPAPADSVLGLLTRAELAGVFPEVRGRTKPEWIAACLSRYPDQLVRARLARCHPWIGVSARPAFDVCQVLFFGGSSQDLSTFVVQDLGIRTYEDYALDGRSRPFGDRPALERYLRCRRLAAMVRRLDEIPALAPWILRGAWPDPLGRMERRLRDGVLNELGRWHERRGELAEAQDCYGRSTSHPARVRLARLAHRLADEPALETLLEGMRCDPWAAEELDFATRFPRRRRAAAPAITTCRLPGDTPARVEHHALRLLTGNGGRGWHLENHLPLGLAGLVFWEEIFAPAEGAFSHPFQLGPQDLFWADFARTRRAALRERIDGLGPPGAFEARVRAVFRDKRGIANRLVHWGVWSRELLDALLTHVPHERLAAIAIHTITNLPKARSGFPDLLVIYGSGAWELVEVKGPTDQLQPAQRVWLATLESLAVPVRVLRFKSAC